MRYFITSTDDKVGKTVVSSILVQALSANYWKPIQIGDLEDSDSLKVAELTSKKINIYPETYRFKESLPLRLAAKKEGVEINLIDLVFPTSTQLIIEGAGGILNPMNEKGAYLTDMIPFLEAEVIFVTKSDAESINQSLLSIQSLQTKNISLKGIVVTGEEKIDTESILIKETGIPILFHVPITKDLSKLFIKEQAVRIRSLLNK